MLITLVFSENAAGYTDYFEFERGQIFGKDDLLLLESLFHKISSCLLEKREAMNGSARVRHPIFTPFCPFLFREI